MEHIARDITELVGRTPLLEAARFGKARGLSCRLLAKLEYLNPAGSVKDRVALWMIREGERSGALAPGATIIEPTSGNTGIGLAAVGAARGYRVILTMPETMSKERRDLLKAYGAQIVLTEGDKGMAGAIAKAEELAASIPGSFVPGQFDNPANPQAHYDTTGPELWEQTGGQVDLFVDDMKENGEVRPEDEAYISGKYQKIMERLPEIDAILEGASKGWKIGRMNKVDLTILRLAVYEMRYDGDIPEKVAINEAVELSKKFGGDDSPSFVNGVLAKLADKAE